MCFKAYQKPCSGHLAQLTAKRTDLGQNIKIQSIRLLFAYSITSTAQLLFAYSITSTAQLNRNK